jgi:hypothetical protein
VNSDLARQKYRKAARAVSFVVVYSGLAVWLYHFHVWYQYDSMLPRQQDVVSSRIYPQNTHGHVVYLTKDENARLTKLSVVSLGLVIGGFLFYGSFVDRGIFH